MSAPVTSPIRYPRSAGADGYSARAVAAAYGAPSELDGSGVTIGVIELGGAYNAADLTALGGNPSRVTCLGVDGGGQQSDPQGADGEVMLDVEVIAGVAPGAAIRVYFADNSSDAGFHDAIVQAATECQVISISWGSPESGPNGWDPASIRRFSATFAAARAHGVTVFAAAGDAGSRDGTSSDVTDYPASDPNVVGCGGTRLSLDSSGHRTAEVVWDDDPEQSATGGGVSRVFRGRQVPDVAGNADPETGYRVVVDGQRGVAGGTSAVAPLYAAMTALALQANGHRAFDFLNTVSTNPSVCFDVTSGNNGGYKAGPGRDDVTGLGVVDVGKLIRVLTSGVQVPSPGGTTQPTPTQGTGVPRPAPTPAPVQPTPAPVPSPVPAPAPLPAPVSTADPTMPSQHDLLGLLRSIATDLRNVAQTIERAVGVGGR